MDDDAHELRNRGVGDVLITCRDGLKDLPEAVGIVWPETTVQTCVVHLVRNRPRYASKADWVPITRGLRAIYAAATIEAAIVEFEAFADRWRTNYPVMIASDPVIWCPVGNCSLQPCRNEQCTTHRRHPLVRWWHETDRWFGTRMRRCLRRCRRSQLCRHRVLAFGCRTGAR